MIKQNKTHGVYCQPMFLVVYCNSITQQGGTTLKITTNAEGHRSVGLHSQSQASQGWGDFRC